MTRLRNFLNLPPADRLLLMEAGVWLGVAKLAILTLPFRWITRGWGEPEALAGEASGKTPSPLLEQISWAVATASRHLPWDCSCLTQAMAGKAMLQRRGISSTLYLGLTKNGLAQVQGHAWLRCGEQVLTGREGIERFTVISSFAEDGK